jgi:hypothetical protein
MIASTRAAMFSVLAAGLALSAPVAAQVTDAQRSAIRSACRSDYQKNCASVTPGGIEALQCLQKNMASLSSACQTAVRAVEPPPAPKVEAAPPAPPAAAKAEPAPAPAKTETAAPKTEPPPAVAKPAPGTVKPAPAAKSTAPAGAPPSAAAGAPQPSAKPLALRPMLPREQLFVLRSACGADVRTLCEGVAPGGGRIIQCLAVRADSLSPACKDVLMEFAQ